mmetsp:Transcript_45822/g.132697  ORF Transcript_45822/g.132697 Transcript_45822/m.132697 type:complete len:269 (+) Transcript_45822:41-847(+)
MMADSTEMGSHEAASSMEVFCRSLAVVGVAELFDKTWFMGLLLALRYRAATVFTGSITALLLHTVLAAALGYAFARLLSPRALNFLAAGLFMVFALLYARDWHRADPNSDALAAGRQEAEEDCGLEDGEAECGGSSKSDELSDDAMDADLLSDGGEASSKAAPEKTESSDLVIFTKSFAAVFIAEWGDRTQIAMVGQHASQPLLPVFLGSSVAFFLLTLSAVLAASLLAGQKLSERLVYGVSTICFAIFAILALRDALTAPDAGAVGR